MLWIITIILIKILREKKPNMKYIDKNKNGGAHMHIQQQEITLKYR